MESDFGNALARSSKVSADGVVLLMMLARGLEILLARGFEMSHGLMN